MKFDILMYLLISGTWWTMVWVRFCRVTGSPSGPQWFCVISAWHKDCVFQRRPTTWGPNTLLPILVSIIQSYWCWMAANVPKCCRVPTALNWFPAVHTGVCCPGCEQAETGWSPHTAAAESCLQMSGWPGTDLQAVPSGWARKTNS